MSNPSPWRDPGLLKIYFTKPEALEHSGNCAARVFFSELEYAILQRGLLKLALSFLAYFAFQIGIWRSEKAVSREYTLVFALSILVLRISAVGKRINAFCPCNTTSLGCKAARLMPPTTSPCTTSSRRSPARNFGR